MKATALLKKQHRKVEGIFAALEKEKGDASAVLAQLANDLTAHMAIEQTLFYPAVREIDPGARMQHAFQAASKQGYESLLPQGLATSADRDQTPMPPRLRRAKRARSRSGRVAP